MLATKDNVEANGVSGVITTLHSDEEGDLAPVDLMIANILANPLVDLCPHLSGLVRPGGRIVLSGILDEQLEMVKQAYGQYFDDLTVATKDQWCRISGVKK